MMETTTVKKIEKTSEDGIRENETIEDEDNEYVQEEEENELVAYKENMDNYYVPKMACDYPDEVMFY